MMGLEPTTFCMASSIVPLKKEPPRGCSRRGRGQRRLEVDVSAGKPTPAVVIRVGKDGTPFFEAKSRDAERQRIKRRLGPAWVEPDGAGGWRRRRGRPPTGWLDERAAHAAAAEKVAEVERERAAAAVKVERAGTATVRQVAREWLEWKRDVKGGAPSTPRDNESLRSATSTSTAQYCTRSSVARCLAALRSAFASAGERLDLLDLVVVERWRGRLVPHVGTADRVRCERVRVGLHRVGEATASHFAGAPLAPGLSPSPPSRAGTQYPFCPLNCDTCVPRAPQCAALRPT
jgi:hypothetical protein